MDGLSLTLVILGVILILAFVAWFSMTERRQSKATVLMCDTVLIILSVAVLITGLKLRNRTLEEEQNLRKQEMSEQIEEFGIFK